MSGRFSITLSRTGSFRPENLGQNTLSVIAKLCFTLFAIGMLVFTIIAATCKPGDALLHPINATVKSANGVIMVGEGFLPSNQKDSAAFINITDINYLVLQTGVEEAEVVSESRVCGFDDQIKCGDPNVFHLLMRAAMEKFRNIQFYQFRKPVRGDNYSSCHMAWQFRPNQGNLAAFYKDYRSFTLVKSDNCTFNVVGIGEYHSGGNARKRKGKWGGKNETNPIALPKVQEIVNDVIPEVESDGSFSRGKYLIYSGGGDRCKTINQYLWSFTCMLGEAEYLNRTLVMDMSICLSKMYTSSGQNEEGKDFRFYFDFERLKDAALVLDQSQFWSDWAKWLKEDKMSLHLVEGVKVKPTKLVEVKNTLIMRKFGSDPDNSWFRVCEGEAGSVIQRPWRKIWKSRRLLDVASAIASRMNWDFDAVHVERGGKVRNKELWPNLDRDTSPEALLTSLQYKIEYGRNLYIATDEADVSFFDSLKDKYSTRVLDDYKDLWDENSDWYFEMMKLNNGNPVEFDGFMRSSVDTEVFLRGKRQIETFNDLTKDCKDGINTSTSAS